MIVLCSKFCLTSWLSNSMIEFVKSPSAGVALYALFASLIWTGLRWRSARQESRDASINRFNQLVKELSAQEKETQLSTAILLRQYIQDKTFAKQTINVLSSILRVQSTGVLQKTLVDGLAYAHDLSWQDLQKTNLQDAYIGRKLEIPLWKDVITLGYATRCHKIKMYRTDLFLADLSYALLQNVIGQRAVFYKSIMCFTRVKDCDLRYADFRGANLLHAQFVNVQLDGADFTDARNIPEDIAKRLVKGKYESSIPAYTASYQPTKNIFFSMPSITTPEENSLMAKYEDILVNLGFSVIKYQRDQYPTYGQLTKVRESVLQADAIITFGFKQVELKQAFFRPNTSEQQSWDGKWLSTPWSDIETGMAMMKNIPILLVCDAKVDTGIFDSKLSECFLFKMVTDYHVDKIERSHIFIEWLKKFA